MGDVFTNGAETTVTIKESTKHDAMWLVFRGRPEEIREQILATFGYESASVTGLTMLDVAIKAKKDFQAGGLIASNLGGTPVPPPSGDAKPSDSGQPPFDPDPPKDNGWGNVNEGATQAPAAPADPNQPHLEALEKCTTVDAVKLYWGENQAAFLGNEVLTAAYNARGKALMAAAQ